MHHFLQSVKDNLGLKTPGVYSIPCECGQVYIGGTGHSIDNSLKEHHRHIPYVWNVWTSQPWWNTVSTWGTASSYTKPTPSPPNTHTWIASSGT
jgi:hypothetical protein